MEDRIVIIGLDAADPDLVESWAREGHLPVIASLLAGWLTSEPKYAEWHALVHDWSFQHFPDAEHGEWFGYLHRDGRQSSPLKGNLWKGPFHLPRMLLKCWKILA